MTYRPSISNSEGARERRRRVRNLCAPHQSRRSPMGSGSVLARAMDLGPRARPDPGVPATAVPRRSPAFASLAPGGLARRPLHRTGCRVVDEILFGPESHWQGSGSFALRGGGWVVGIGGCIAGCAHPLEKSATSFVDASIHCL